MHTPTRTIEPWITVNADKPTSDPSVNLISINDIIYWTNDYYYYCNKECFTFALCSHSVHNASSQVHTTNSLTISIELDDIYFRKQFVNERQHSSCVQTYSFHMRTQQHNKYICVLKLVNLYKNGSLIHKFTAVHLFSLLL